MCRLLLGAFNVGSDYRQTALPADVVNYNHTVFYSLRDAVLARDSGQPCQDDKQRVVCVTGASTLANYTTLGRPDLWNGTGPTASIFGFSLSVLKTTQNLAPTGQPSTVGYALWERSHAPTPQMPLPYEVAELVVEGRTSLTFSKDFDKYNFFRIHNFNSTPLTVAFQGTDFGIKLTVTVPSYGCQCVRRDAVDSGYELGYRYFFKVHHGDPRTYSSTTYPTDTNLQNYCVANNVLNPHLANDIVSAAANIGDGNGAKMHCELTRLWDASSLYCGDGKPFAPIADATLIGDLLIHRGDLLNVTSPDGTQWMRDTMTFNSFSTLQADFGAHNFAVAFDVDGQPIIRGNSTHQDLISVSTNFLTAPNTSILPALPVRDATKAFRIQNFNAQSGPWHGAIDGVVNATTTVTTYTDPTGVNTAFTAKSLSTSYVAGTPIKLATHTLAATKTALIQADTAASTSTDKAVKMTGFGLWLFWNRHLQLTADPSGILDAVSYLGTRSLTSDGTLITPNSVNFFGYGWPDFLSANPFFSPIYPVYFAGRRNVTIPGIYPEHGSMGYAYMRPDWTYYWEQFPIAWSAVRAIADKRAKGTIRILSAFTEHDIFSMIGAYVSKTKLQTTSMFGVTSTYDFTGELDVIPPGDTTSNTVWGTIRAKMLTNDYSFELNAADSDEFIFTRPQRICDHYNNLASIINSVVKVEPLNFNNIFPLLENNFGIFGSHVRPKNQYYATNYSGDYFAAAFSALGISKKTEADFPPSLQTLLTKKVNYSRLTANASVALSVGPNIEAKDLNGPPGLADATWEQIQIDPNPIYVLTGVTQNPLDTTVMYYTIQYNYSLDSVTEEIVAGDTINLQSSVAVMLFGNDNLNSNPYPGQTGTGYEHYIWYAVEDVKAAAERLGFKFKFFRLVQPITVKYAESSGGITSTFDDNSAPYPFTYLDHWNTQFDPDQEYGNTNAPTVDWIRVDGVTIHHLQQYTTAAERDNALANMPRIATAQTQWRQTTGAALVADPTGDWITDPINRKVRQQTYSGQTTVVLDTYQPHGGGFAVVSANVGGLYWSIAARIIQKVTASDVFSFPQFAPDVGQNCLAWQDFSTTPTAKILLTPSPYMNWGSDGAGTFVNASGSPSVSTAAGTTSITPVHVSDIVTVFVDQTAV